MLIPLKVKADRIPLSAFNFIYFDYNGITISQNTVALIVEHLFQ